MKTIKEVYGETVTELLDVKTKQHRGRFVVHTPVEGIKIIKSEFEITKDSFKEVCEELDISYIDINEKEVIKW